MFASYEMCFAAVTEGCLDIRLDQNGICVGHFISVEIYNEISKSATMDAIRLVR